MSKRLKDQNACPPGGWFKYHDTTHNTILKAPSFRRLLGVVRKYHEANHLPIPNEQQVIDNVCAGMPSLCFDSDTPPLWKMAVNATVELGKWAAAGVPVTEKDALASRLAICEECNYWGGARGASLMNVRCGKCGCTGIKLAMATTKCPIGKW